MRDSTGEQTVAAPARSPHNLVAPLTSFIGRHAEIEAATGLLERHRLVTLTGPGGAGKTRLAARVATGQSDRQPDGVWWVDLATVSDGTAVAEVIAEAVGAPIVGGRVHALRTHLSAWRSLLCLDNAEHLLDGVASTVEAVLSACPRMTVLVTSREPLGVPGEAVLGVPPLSDDDALALFVDRARLVQPSFTLDESREATIRSIAAHLDGIPLALELAAAWLRTLTPQQVEAGLDDRFTLLVRGPRGAQRRQRTLLGSIDWSYRLLNDTDRVVLRRLAVFAGTFGLSAARALCAEGAAGAAGTVTTAEVLPSLGRLVDKSLVVADVQAGESRYRLLETIRAFAAARLAEAAEGAALRERHLAWFLRFVEAAEQDRERDADGWQRALVLEYDNLRAALEWGLAAEDPHAGRQLAASLAWLWHLDRRGREGIGFLRRAIDRVPDERSRLQARLVTGLALVADTAGPLDVERDAASRAVRLATDVGDEGLRALCLNLLAVGSFYTDFDEAWQLCEQAHAAARAGGNTFVLGGSRALQAIILHLRDQHAEAELLVDDHVRQCLRHHRGVLSTLLTYQAEGALAGGDPVRALSLATEALLVAEPLGDYLRVGMARSALAQIKALTGDLAGATEVIDPVLRLVEGAEDDIFVPGLDHAVATLSMRRDDPRAAIDPLRRAAGSTDRGAATWLAARALPRLGAALSTAGRPDEAAAVLDQAVEVARRLRMPGPLAEAYAAQAELAAADPDGLPRAVELHHEALTIRVDHRLRTGQLDSLEALARVGAAIQPAPDDVRVLYAAESARTNAGLPRGIELRRAYDSTTADLRRALGATAFDRAAAEGARLTLDQAVEYVRRARGRRGRPASGWPSLTPTELQVVRLVAEGLTNPQIGDRLLMSRGTVKTHLSHIFTKLDTTNRAQLAAAAVDRGLSPGHPST
ncbi:LuxR C-terminal-related transcriptional regulator [Phytohabitans aurantiacus]|uniref:LuxR family transcriptional regulator n=1 Tax=Phytohabitans aurantiacus TaxID=3016789 RepID=A0ABQ5QRB2_9ACTN|nr:LuxR C-terminal-related transcriptional regulator [Phytohabitans aurantiacus]GLH96517.1 LuxR family transcriptional regulator [Phytohabitans aurantiacus]